MEPEATSVPSMDDTMSAAYDKAVGEPEAAPAEVKAETPKVEAVVETAPVKDVKEPQATETPDAPVEQKVDAPRSWPKELSTEFAKLSPEAQAALAKHESERDRNVSIKLQEASEARQFADAFKQTITPHMEFIQREGGTPLVAVQTLLQTARAMKENPAGTLRYLAHQLGVDLNSTENPVSPAPEYSALVNRLHQVEGALNNFQQQTQQQVFSKAESELTSFAKDPSHGHFQKVAAEMGRYLQAGLAENLQDAYDKACWENPEIRQELIDQQVKAKQEEARKKAELASKANVVNIRGTGAVPTSRVKGSIEDTMSAAYDRAVGS